MKISPAILISRKCHNHHWISGIQMWMRAPKTVIQGMLLPTMVCWGAGVMQEARWTGLTPDGWGAYERNEFSESRGLHLPILDTSLKKQESSRKASTSALVLLTMPKPLIVWIITNCGKFLKRWEYQSTWPASWEICMQVKKQKLELDMAQHTGSKSGKEYVKAVYCHPAYLTYMQSTSCEMLDWMKHKLESRLPGEISET